MADLTSVWIFHGLNSQFASGVFTSKQIAETWIIDNKLAGILTEYPLDIGVYQWAVERGSFKPTKDHHVTPAFIQGFSSASQQHHHYEKDVDDSV
jgi:hypothetical protein